MTAKRKDIAPALDSETKYIGTITLEEWHRLQEVEREPVHVVQHQRHPTGVAS